MKISLLVLSLLLQAPASVPVATGVVTGRVLSESGQPRPGITVMAAATAFRDGRRIVVPLAVSIPGTMGLTDASGHYRLENIPPGPYYIVADPRPQSNDRSGDESNGEVATLFPGVTPLQDARTVDVNEGSETQDIDFLMVHRHLVNVRGHVFDAVTGAPSQSAVVSLNGGLLASFRTMVDTNGAFEIRGVPSGEYALSADDSSRVILARFASRQITIGDGGVDNADLFFRPSVFVKGRVVFEHGERVTNPGTTVGITANNVEGTLGSGSTALMDGTFQLGGRVGLVEGEYRISVDHLPGDYYVKSMSFGTTNLLENTLKLSGPVSEEVLVTLASGTHVSGNVTRENREPAARVRVFLLPPDPRNLREAQLRTVETDNTGAFNIRGVAPGNYIIFAAPLFANFAPDESFIRYYQSRTTPLAVSGNSPPITLITIR